jgi:predicted ATPase
MLTRLKVSGFKNLVDVDVRFGPFTCIAGPNGVGKSNLFDAIRFLSALADKPLVEAALSVRDEGGRTADLRSLFHRAGTEHDRRMSFDAEMIVPATGTDDLGQEARASKTVLRYRLVLEYKEGTNHHGLGTLALISEDLLPIKTREVSKNLLFQHDKKEWLPRIIIGHRGKPFISTAEGKIRLHQDAGSGGLPQSRAVANLPRTMLSAANAAESPTALLARREMQTWRLLQLEPSALREPDSFTARTTMESNGAHLASTLYHLANIDPQVCREKAFSSIPEAVYTRVANRLAELISDIREISVDRDEKRQLYTVIIRDAHGTAHAARALSDGTLRFLALAVVEADPNMTGVLCFEEPENGIHPERIPAMLSLLQDIASDPNTGFDPAEPLRQVIVNTHSPAVVAQVPDDSLLIAESKEIVRDGKRSSRVVFSTLPETWRTKDPSTSIASKGKLLSYLNPIASRHAYEEQRGDSESQRSRRRVIDRPDLTPYLPWPDNGK